MKKKLYSLISITLILSLAGCSTAQPADSTKAATFQKEINRISRYESNIPTNYEYFDYKTKALAIDELLFDTTKTGTYLPLMWEDTTYQSFGIPAYVGDGRMHQDGAQEAVTAIAAVLSATQLGIDKSNQNGTDYVAKLSAFYSETEKIVLNNPSGSSESTSMWYLLYPAILFSQVSYLYPEETLLREQALECIANWYEAYQIMAKEQSFDYTGFNFIKMEPYQNGIWKEPDSAAGIGLLLYYGYELTGKSEYLDGAIVCMEYLNSYFGSPMYEALLYFAPSLSALLNAEHGASINVDDMLNDILNGSSIPRGGWGSIVGQWGDYSMNGLMGSTTDGGGYAFAMNTFSAAYAISSLAKYDSRYASSIGKWILNVVGNSRYFFADQTKIDNQSMALSESAKEFATLSNFAVPYEGIRKSSNSKTPWFGGDPTVYGWAETDFSLYSGAHVGLLGSMIESTNVDAILKVDLNKSDLFHQTFPTYLIYNPHDSEKTVTYQPQSNTAVDLYDNVTKQYVAKNVEGETKLTIASGDSVVIIEVPVGTTIEKDGNAYYVEDEIIGSDGVTISVTNYDNLSKVSGTVQLELGIMSTIAEDSVESIEVKVNETTYTFDDKNKVKLSVSELGTGSKSFEIAVCMKSGLKDRTEIRLILE